MNFEVIVAGLGGMGSVAAAQLAQRGHSVLGLERFQPAHDQGSSHGDTRIIRLAYFEDPAYVPLLQRSFELWREAEELSGKSLLTETGGLMIGPPDSQTVAGALRSAREWDLEHELWSASELKQHYPQFQLEEDEVGFFEKKAGFVRPEQSCLAHHQIAEAAGAQLHFGEQIHRWEVEGGGVVVYTDRNTYRADRLVVSAGPWNSQLLGELALPLQVQRLTIFWFGLQNHARWVPEQMPIYIWEPRDLEQFYGFPAIDGPRGGAKIVYFRVGPNCEPDQVDRTVTEAEERLMRKAAARLPDLNGPVLRTATCLYTNTPDEHFVVGLHPAYPQVSLAAGFSGHGFKFASVMGEILADLALEQQTWHPIELFSPTRFG